MESATSTLCEALDWDSSFWGFRVARLRADTLTEATAEEVDDWCRRQHVACLYFLARADDPTTRRFAERGGYRLVDLRMTLARDVPVAGLDRGLVAHDDVIVRNHHLEDIPRLRAIAKVGFRGTRFYSDDRFPSDLCDELYATWIERSCTGFADAVFVAGSDAPVGFITCHLDPERVRGRIGLVGVDWEARGQGVGRALVDEALAWLGRRGAQAVEVTTQGANCQAQRLYQRCGFLTQSVALWYHKWF